ncbi:alpha/beta hydrolase [Saccharothrix coeruleofusca]|uniref:Alpha/beta hydrolase n=1 Tax=Saccharothrix coeruleofusca TaxID=33919 RepID=A0A918EHX1_9PSEU|nr:alpha/beta hydrolase [Saccharothrix coeruleofusca]
MAVRTHEDLAFVVGHGFTNHVRKPWVARVLERFARHGGVVALDFRGHGRSGGRSTVGGDEVHDLAAGVSLARDLGYRRVVTVGFSMGASIALRHAALHEDRPDAVAAVSSPSRWWVRETAAMRRVHWLLEQPHGRLAARALGVRLGPPWATVPESPLEVVHRIAPTPLLIVHGEDDHYFGPAHATALHRAAGGNAELWLEPGTRHAESAMTPALVDRIATWLSGASQRSASEQSRRGR